MFHKSEARFIRRHGHNINVHNNRKCTRGRHTQYIKIGNSTKPIYHDS